MASIHLGYMNIEDGEWTVGSCFCHWTNNEDCTACKDQSKPDDIILPQQTITVIYGPGLSYGHHTNNKAGFKRAELSKQIMRVYMSTYKEVYTHILHSLYPCKGQPNTFTLGIDT